MTVGEALRIMHQRGQIATAWLPGMLFDHPVTPSGAKSFRVLESTNMMVMGWDGLYPVRYTLRDDGWVVEVSIDGVWGFEPITHHAPPRDWEPALGDACTNGGLITLLREARSDPSLHVSPETGQAAWWWVWDGKHGAGGHRRPREEHAVRAALVTAAGG